MGLNFEVIGRKPKVERMEKYDFPVLTVLPETTIEGGVQKFELNNAAVKALNFNDKINFIGLAFNDSKQLCVVNLGNSMSKISAKVNKDFTFNSSRIYNILQKQIGFNKADTYEFRLNVSLDGEANMFCGIIEWIDTPTTLTETVEESVFNRLELNTEKDEYAPIVNTQIPAEVL